MDNSTLVTSAAVSNGIVYFGTGNVNTNGGRLYAVGQAPAGHGGQPIPSPTKSPGFTALVPVLAIAGGLFLIRR